MIQNTKQKRPSPVISPQRSSPKPPMLVPTSAKNTNPQTTSAITALLQTSHSIASLSQSFSLHNSPISTQNTFITTKPQLATARIITSSPLPALPSGVITSIQTTSSNRVSVPSLNAMLQSHPAATIAQTVPTTDTITTASILASQQNLTQNIARPGLVSARPTPKLEESILNTKLTKALPVTNLLHTHLTKSPLKRASISDESENMVEIKTEIKTEIDEVSSSKDNLSSGKHLFCVIQFFVYHLPFRNGCNGYRGIRVRFRRGSLRNGYHIRGR